MESNTFYYAYANGHAYPVMVQPNEGRYADIRIKDQIHQGICGKEASRGERP